MSTLNHSSPQAARRNLHWHSMFFAAALFMTCILVDAQLGAPAIAQSSAAPQAAPAPAAAAEEQRQFAEAVRLYRGGRWSGAYGRFMALADRGHARAARIALAMQRDGQAVYGALWDATPGQLEAWQRVAAPAPASLLVLNP